MPIFTSRLAGNRTRRLDLRQEIAPVERQLSTAGRRITPGSVERLGQVIAVKLRSPDRSVRQGYARRFIEKVIVSPETITFIDPIKPLELAANDDAEHQAPMVPSFDRDWCATQSGANQSPS